MSKPSIVYQTDFSLDGGSVSTMRGVSMQIDPTLDISDITHTIEPFNILQASSSLMYVEPYWPKGTIFVSVVDPGVGTERKASVALLKDGNYVVTPDNGTLTHLAHTVGIAEIREIDEKHRYKGTEAVNVFHGRDLFAYIAAKMAAGVVSYEEVGPSYPVSEVVILEDLMYGKAKPGEAWGVIVAAWKHFGNIVTNIRFSDFAQAGFKHGDILDVEIKHDEDVIFHQKVLYHKSFGFVKKGEPIVFNGSSFTIALALNQGNFMEKYHIRSGADWKITFRG
ncbi:MAG: SAM-dependent chlorinase/fluorinase [Erysipelotrichaceae bacterium]|jgi:S-adenosylmethionine hydrolase|nr:SAM-dependent chlorinase/fluorinase [Erysipelotrichaceae bacterium]